MAPRLAAPHGQPLVAHSSLELESDAGDVVGGTAFVLDGEQLMLGDAPGNEIRISGAQLPRRHLRLSQQDGAWFVADIHSTMTAQLNGHPVGSEPRGLRDGDRICIRARENVVLVFHDRGRLITGVARHGAVVTFCPWHKNPLLAYALRKGDDVLRTALETQWLVASNLSSVTRFDNVAGMQIIDDIHGVFLGDVMHLSREENATIDVGIVIEAARLASTVPSGVHLRSRALLTFGGALVWLGEPVGSASSSMRQNLIEQLLLTIGCPPRATRDPERLLSDQREALGAIHLEPHARDALLRLVETAAIDPDSVPVALASASAALGGPPTAESVRSLVVNLFPNEHARHVRVTEEALLLGFDGLAASE